ncbi:hypothetical protein [Mycolicibacterium peregrinum]|uniref:Uncharacterized protein n=1 Tax=Mycolicibacterium peregrinum TaxID=43304 RepID=A0A1A0WCD8_MYCPR|nr:hypothetical protein [Mycolicibacterium peregrinum]OBB94876.1 hypothetical protein A5779_19025 [Mycolicibacterium peregrinum]
MNTPDTLDLNTTGHTPNHCLSLGMGVESVAILLRWINEPDTRDLDLRDFVAISAMTGDEFDSTSRDMEEVVLPAMRRAGVRFVQVGRNRLNTTKAGDGITVFSETDNPTRLHIQGDFALSSELLSGGTIPQLGGARRCSARAKGIVLDATIARITAGQPFEHYIGFHTGEMTRVRRDQEYNTALRTGRYPLLDWGWSREDAAAYLLEATGRSFTKSCCTYCPLALATATGRQNTLERYRQEPDSGAKALFVEHVSLCFNHRQGLTGEKRLIDAVTDAGLSEVLDRFHQRIAATGHAIYELRRLTRPCTGTSPMIARSVRRLHTGARADLQRQLLTLPGTPVTGPAAITRVVVRERDESTNWAEQFYVIAPNVTADKQRPQFDAWWSQLTAPMELFAV